MAPVEVRGRQTVVCVQTTADGAYGPITKASGTAHMQTHCGSGHGPLAMAQQHCCLLPPDRRAAMQRNSCSSRWTGASKLQGCVPWRAGVEGVQ